MKAPIVSLLIYLLMQSMTASYGQSAKEVIKRLEEQLPVIMEKADIPGLSIAYISKGKLQWYKGFGVTSTLTKMPVTDSSVFEAASLSKPVFAYAVMKLVDERKLDLDKPLSQYLPIPYPGVYDPRISQVTARQVLSHSSGFPNWRSGDTLKIYFNPGERFSYSGEGYVYLSKVVESITGEKFNDFMKHTVLEPLGMYHSSYSWQETYDSLKVFRHNTRGEATSRNKMAPGTFNAAASLHTTAEDYGKFVTAVLQSKGITRKTRELMLTTVVPVRAGGAQTINRPQAPPFPGVSWGLGWGLQDIQDKPSFFHWGDNGDFKAFVICLEKQQEGFVMFANSIYGLSIVQDIASLTLGVDLPAIAWLRLESYHSAAREFFRNLVSSGATSVLPKYLEWRKTQPADSIINEDRMNRIGLDLLRMGKVADAIEILKQNVSDHPQSFNVYDSLGEAYAAMGNKELAIKNYEISIQINPSNKDGQEALKKLKQ